MSWCRWIRRKHADHRHSYMYVLHVDCRRSTSTNLERVKVHRPARHMHANNGAAFLQIQRTAHNDPLKRSSSSSSSSSNSIQDDESDDEDVVMIVPKPKKEPIAAAETQNDDDEIQIIGSTGKNALSGTILYIIFLSFDLNRLVLTRTNYSFFCIN